MRWILGAVVLALAPGCPASTVALEDAGSDAPIAPPDTAAPDGLSPVDAPSTDGAGGDADATPEDPPLSADEAAAFVATAATCQGSRIGGLDDRVVAAWIERSRVHAGVAHMARCVIAAGGDCAAFGACGLMAGVQGGTCTSMRCEGDQLLMCIGPPGTPGSLVTIDCRALGLSCVDATPAGAFGCGEACTASSCDADGRGGLWCANGVGSRIECAAGYRCSLESLDPVSCVGDGPACTASRCEDEALVVCDDVSGAERPPRDCGEVGGTCGGAGPDCVPSASECVPGASPPTCDGTVITYCAPSHTLRTVDCAALGFSSCLTVTGSGAYCRP